jgi:hypothetical protein
MPASAGYAKRQPPPEKMEDPVTVLVTGFGVRTKGYVFMPFWVPTSIIKRIGAFPIIFPYRDHSLYVTHVIHSNLITCYTV